MDYVWWASVLWTWIMVPGQQFCCKSTFRAFRLYATRANDAKQLAINGTLNFEWSESCEVSIEKSWQVMAERDNETGAKDDLPTKDEESQKDLIVFSQRLNVQSMVVITQGSMGWQRTTEKRDVSSESRHESYPLSSFITQDQGCQSAWFALCNMAECSRHLIIVRNKPNSDSRL